MSAGRLERGLRELVDRQFRRGRRIHNMVLGVAVGRDGFRWAGAAGVADPDNGAAMTPETPFAVASVTKMYTAAAAMLLWERGRLEPDDRITAHLPESVTRGLHRYGGTDRTGDLTIRHLLAHTSGFPDYFLARPKGGRSAFEALLDEGDRAWELDDVVRYTRESLPPVAAPGGKARYSDTNYKLLGAVLESASGAPLHELFEELFFRPLALDRTRLAGHPRGDGNAAPAGQYDRPAVARVFHEERALELDRLLASHGPEGGLVSTVDDTLRFAAALLSGDLFERPETLAAMRDWRRIFFPIDYGWGLMRFRMPRLLNPFGHNPELVGHSGSSGSFLFHDPAQDLYMTGTFNQMKLQRAPFQLMMKAARLVHRERTA